MFSRQFALSPDHVGAVMATSLLVSGIVGPAANRIEEQPGHAAGIVATEDHYWMVCVRIASAPGLGDGQTDLEGVYLQPLSWRTATAEMRARIVTRDCD